MLLRILSVLICLMLLVPVAQADEIFADSKLHAVTVYSNRAMLTRRAVVDIPAGAHVVVFKNLPASLLTDSLRAEGKAVADVKFGALASKMVMEAELIAPREKELNEQLEALQDQRAAVVAEKNALGAKSDFLSSLSQQASLRAREDIAEINLKPDQWDAAAQTLQTGMGDVYKAQLAHEITLRGIDRQIAKIQAEIGQLYTGQRSTYQVTLPLESSAATKLTVDISYQIPDATWTPLYDARLDTKGEKLELVQYGAVTQSTGEDWEGVELTLSTAQPQRGAGLPDLDTMWVNLYVNEPLSDWQRGQEVRAMYSNVAANMEGGALSADNAMRMAESAIPVPMAAPVAKEAQFTSAVIETGGFVSEYRIPGPSTVKADGTQSKLMIGTFDTENEIRIQVKPQLSAEAYLVAHTKLRGEAPILAGPVSLFRDGSFIGQANLPLLRPGQESDLAFGIDDQVSVKRRVLKDERSEAGVLTKDSVQERNFVTELQNLHSKPVTVVVLETIPVAQNKQINIMLVDDRTTSGYIKDPDNVKGLMRWSVPVASKQKAEVNLGWKVSWPKDQMLSGL